MTALPEDFNSSNTQLSDEELVTLLVIGEASAFETIYRRHASGLYSFLRKNLHDSDECEEILQDIFISLWERREKLNIRSLKYYLFTAARYRIVNHIQHSVVKRKYEADFRAFEKNEYALQPDIDPSLAQRMEKCISALPPDRQAIIKLRLHEQLSYQEIADRLHITVKSVDAHMQKAFTHFRTHCLDLLDT